MRMHSGQATGQDGMNLSRDETRALGFVVMLLTVSAGVRLIDRPKPVSLDAAGVDIAALEAASRAAEGSNAKPPPLAPGERIDPNTATLDQLMRLPRMRRATAQAIVAGRTDRPFRTIADLDRLPGVGPAALESWRPHLTLREGVAARPAPTPTPSPPTRGADASNGAPVPLNSATAADLERVPGIGPALASRIIAKRDSTGAFRAVDDLLAVRGIGPATLEKLKRYLVVY